MDVKNVINMKRKADLVRQHGDHLGLHLPLSAIMKRPPLGQSWMSLMHLDRVAKARAFFGA